LAKATAAARPMPERAPVIKTTGLFMALLLMIIDAYNFFNNRNLSIDFPLPWRPLQASVARAKKTL
jgi:hypothetical protein